MAEATSTPAIDVAAVRSRFSALGQGFAFLDAPGGSQVPDEVGEAIARALREASANLGAGYATSQRAGAILAEAEVKGAGFLGCDAHEVIFGPNMTSLNFALSRTAGRAFQPGDEILVSSASSARAPGSSPSRGRRTRSGPSSTPGVCSSLPTMPGRSPGWTPCTMRRTSPSTSARSALTC